MLQGLKQYLLVESPAIEEDFIALKSAQEVKLAEVNKREANINGRIASTKQTYL
jgi:hypothetical protein